MLGGIYETETLPPIRVAPDVVYRAEVVVLVTTLGVKRHEFNESNRARDLLEVYRSHCKVIDFNLDSNVELSADTWTSSRVNKGDLEVIRKLYTQKKLMQDAQDGLIVLPRILIDGVNVGDCADLQALGDEDLLEGILKREVCPKCLRQRKNDAKTCRLCDEVFEELMPGRHTIEEVLATFPRADDEREEAGFVVLADKK